MDTVYRRYTNEVMNKCLSVEVSWELFLHIYLYTLNDLVLYIWKFKRLKCHSDKGQARIWKLCCGSHQIYFTVRKEETSLAVLLMKYARILQTFIKIRWIKNMLFCNGQIGARYNILTDRENETNYRYSLHYRWSTDPHIFLIIQRSFLITGLSLVRTLATGLMDMMQRSVTRTARREKPVILPNNAEKTVASTNAVSGIF